VLVREWESLGLDLGCYHDITWNRSRVRTMENLKSFLMDIPFLDRLM
jgi:hypothetical protein